MNPSVLKASVVVQMSLTSVTMVREPCICLIKVTSVTFEKSVVPLVQINSTKHRRFSPWITFPPVVTLDP